MKHKVGAKLLLVGILLIALAWFNAASIPWKATQDYAEFYGPPDSKSCYAERISPEPMYFYDAQVRRRLLQNAYLGCAGIVFLAAGVLRVAKSNEE